MKIETYARMKSKMLRNLADHCHDRALEALSPNGAAKWAVLMDACLWAATNEGDIALVAELAKDQTHA